MRIKWYGHSSFLFTSKEGISVITDPYESGAFGGALAYGEILEEADIITVSHDHADHYTPHLRGNPHILKIKGKHTVEGIEFVAVSTYHDASKGAKRGKNLLFCFTMDGIRVCHCGDLGHRLSREELKKIGEVDLLLIPVGGFYTLEPNDSIKVTEDLGPRIAIPMHFKTEKCDFPIVDTSEFLKPWKNVRRIDSSEVDLEADQLPSETEVILLQHAL